MTIRQTNLSHPKYRPDIDGLRAVAVLAVVAFHANWIRGGFIGVDIFFVISGYLISTIIFENLDKGTFSFTEFYARRIKRIFPALLLVLIVCYIFGWFVLLADEYRQLGKHIISGVGFISNFTLWNEAGYFDNSAETKPLLHLWSLGIEEQFYIVWPILVWFAWKRKFNLLTITIVVAIASFVLNIKGIKHDMVATFYSPQTRFWELLCGSLLAWVTLYKKDTFSNVKLKLDYWLSRIVYGERQEADGKTLSNVLSFVGLLLLVYGFWIINKDLIFPGKWALVPVLGAVLIITAGSKAWVNRTILSNKVVVWFGLISFPLYLWHWPILSFARIVEIEVSSRNIRIGAVFLSIVLAWFTYKFVERPLRFGKHGKVKVSVLILLMTLIGTLGYYTYKRANLCSYLGLKNMVFKRKGFEHGLGCSLAWYKGKNDWLFLGDKYNSTVAKLKLSNPPSDDILKQSIESFTKIAITAAKYNTKFALIIAPNKSSIYPEYLPDILVPSPLKYISFFINKLKEIPNLSVYDPTNDLLNLKRKEGILYGMTDTHWNNKGAFLAYSGFSNLLNLPIPSVEFKQGNSHGGDLIGISKLKDFPLHAEDNWDVIWKNNATWTESDIADEQKTAFGSAKVVINSKPLSNKYVWVVGDSFTDLLRPYLNATFKEVRYIGHWKHKLKDLPDILDEVDRKPDMIIVVKVERAF